MWRQTGKEKHLIGGTRRVGGWEKQEWDRAGRRDNEKKKKKREETVRGQTGKEKMREKEGKGR